MPNEIGKGFFFQTSGFKIAIPFCNFQKQQNKCVHFSELWCGISLFLLKVILNMCQHLEKSQSFRQKNMVAMHISEVPAYLRDSMFYRNLSGSYARGEECGDHEKGSEEDVLTLRLRKNFKKK